MFLIHESTLIYDKKSVDKDIDYLWSTEIMNTILKPLFSSMFLFNSGKFFNVLQKAFVYKDIDYPWSIEIMFTRF